MCKVFSVIDNFKTLISKVKHRKSFDEFHNILSFADEIIKENETRVLRDRTLKQEEHPILDLVRALGLSIKSEYIVNLIKNNPRLPDISMDYLYFNPFEPVNNKNDSFYDLKIDVSKNATIDLKKDLVLPWCWNRSRLINAMVSIGKGRLWGEWTQDKINHVTTLWLPIGIAWVDGGNHSITAGIIQGEGILKPNYIYDIRPIYSHIYCDGKYYRRKDNDTIISIVNNIEFAAIFEIGRKMTDANICFQSLI